MAAVVGTGCTSDRSPVDGRPSPAAPAPTSVPGPSIAAGISALPVTSNLWMGTSDLLLEVFDETYRPIANRDVPVVIALERPDGTLLPEQPADIDQPTPGARLLYVARVDLDQVGPWRLHVRTEDATPLTTTVPLDVLPDDGSPALGSPFPRLDTPTATSDPGGIAAISTMPGADPAFYERSVAELIERGEPFLLTVDSVGFRTTDACGAGLGHLIHLHHELPTMRMVHIEPFRMRLAAGALVLDSPDASPRPTDLAEALGATVPPWIFVVDRDGRLWAKFHGIFGSDELRSAINTVSS